MTLQHVWDETSAYGDVILDLDGNGAPINGYTLAGNRIVAQTDANHAASYFLQDALGSTRGLTSGSTVTQSYNYDAFGTLLGDMGNLATNYLFAGQQYDSATGLYSMRARYYDPGVGRFLSRDTWAINYANPVELNRYVYAAGNPVRWSDPTGMVSLFENLSNLKSSLAQHQGFRYFTGELVSGGISGFLGYTVGIAAVSLIEWLFYGDNNSAASDNEWGAIFGRRFQLYDAVANTILGGFLGLADAFFAREALSNTIFRLENGYRARGIAMWVRFVERMEQIRQKWVRLINTIGLALDSFIVGFVYNLEATAGITLNGIVQDPSAIRDTMEVMSDLLIGVVSAALAGGMNAAIQINAINLTLPDIGVGPFKLKGNVAAAVFTNTVATGLTTVFGGITDDIVSG